MKKFWMITMVLVFGYCLKAGASPDVGALREETRAKCEAAAAMIGERGMAAALCEINKKDGSFANGGTFVYMMNMDAVMMAHPMVPSLIGKNLSEVVLKDKNGKEHPMMLVNFARNKGAGWVSYMWPKPGEKTLSEKICYILKVAETNVFVASGFYKN